MAVEENTNWCQSVTGIVLKENQVLLARHTYGPGKNKLIVPGGYVKFQESPQEAVIREIMEETGIQVRPVSVIGIRFNQKDWYVAFKAEYIGGEPRSDGDENSEALWIDTAEALEREDVPDLTKKLIQCALSGNEMAEIPYVGTTRYGAYSFYGVK